MPPSSTDLPNPDTSSGKDSISESKEFDFHNISRDTKSHKRRPQIRQAHYQHEPAPGELQKGQNSAKGKIKGAKKLLPGENLNNQPMIPSIPPVSTPVFIGPEFRSIDTPEKSRQDNFSNESKSSLKYPSHQKPRRREKSSKNRDSNTPSQRIGKKSADSISGNPSVTRDHQLINNDQTGNKNQNTNNIFEQRGTSPRQNNRSRRGSRKERGRSQNRYVSFSDRNNLNRPAPSIPIPTDRGIKLRSQRGGTSRNWWARRWIDAMERLVDPARLQRGRSYARSGQVLNIQETKTGIQAMVQGSRPQPYKVAIQVIHLSSSQWDTVVNSLSEQAIFTAQLLAGEMPGNIESAFESAGVSLFPSRIGDLVTSCSCPDWANPCKHVAATHYILGDRFDDDPFLLFRMRGRSQEQIMDALRARRGQSIADTSTFDEELTVMPSLEDLIENFWEPSEPIDSFPLTINPPAVDMPMLKRLGEPAFLPGESLQALLKPVYDGFTRSALRAAYSEDEPIESNPIE